MALYTLPCLEDPGEVPVHEANKDVMHQPYLPGSSIKGAIRTAVLWKLLRDDKTLLEAALDRVVLRLYSLDLLRELDQMAGGESVFADPNAHRQAVERIFGSERAGNLVTVLQETLIHLCAQICSPVGATRFRTVCRMEQKMGKS